MKTMKCPFLNQMSSSFLSSYSSLLMKNYAPYCPIMSKISRLYSTSTTNEGLINNGKGKQIKFSMFSIYPHVLFFNLTN